ncbi:DBH-like monooxygenase protein 2 homolog [Melanotaenia boesemani]|uniref:DBH-like monooxygenase protein 2 homolog n=1 Tax=Melanotaenia boesemani TaxID=1250792 RepID=UPI001C03B2DC|nr:DBH-like monooxygenase protein 2 homolog [Melanotaenia boesemani]
MSAPLLFLCLLLAWTKTAWARDHTMPFMEYLDPDRLVYLMWGFDNVQGNIKFQLAVNSTGWVGFGLSPNGGMKGSDIVIGGLGPSGSYFTDLHSTGNSMPLVDEEQSYTLLSMTENDGQTIMTFQRPIEACDEKDFHITAQPIKLIYAYGTTDDIKYHGARRGTKEVNLLNYMPRTTPPNVKSISVKVNNITLPPNMTYYHCKVMNFPNLNTKHHIYQIEPEIEHVDVVHHMLLYRCPSSVTEPYDKPCYMGDASDACFGVVASWGVGGRTFELPENAGIPIGGDSDTFYRLEIHYNNPLKKEDITDNSGLRLYYTDQLRQHDVGILTTGMLPFREWMYNIPPKTPQFHTYSTCNTIHFSQLVNPIPDLQVFAVLLHTHLAGRKVRVGHFRDGKQIDFLGLDENYNFEMQQVVSLGGIKTIQHGDEITVECTYNTSDRTKVTKMGLSTTDEMCLAFLFYYPAINVTTCISHPNTTLVSSPNDLTSEENSDHEAYENLLKTLPQGQALSDVNSNTFFYSKGFIREIMKTPTVVCQNKNAGSRLYTTWTLSTGGTILLLLWITMM